MAGAPGFTSAAGLGDDGLAADGLGDAGLAGAPGFAGAAGLGDAGLAGAPGFAGAAGLGDDGLAADGLGADGFGAPGFRGLVGGVGLAPADGSIGAAEGRSSLDGTSEGASRRYGLDNLGPCAALG